MIDKDFIARCNITFKDECEANREKQRKRISDWNENNREKLHQSQRKYYKTDKGRKACLKRNAIHQHRISSFCKTLDEETKEDLKQFYANCPRGYHVDHIIPLSKGGMHEVFNLQYLTPKENMMKGRKVLFIEIQECPECDNPMRALSEETRYCDDCKKAFVAYYRTEGITREHLKKPTPAQP